MKSSVSLIILFLCLVSIVVMAIISNLPGWVWFIPAGLASIATISLYRASYLPRHAVARGMELIRAQDYNNRLVKVGEESADRVVELFNSLIDKLREERVQNREQESLLMLLIEASPMGVVMLDFNMHISMANRSFLKFFNIKNLDEVVGKKITEIGNELIPDMMKVELGKSEIVRKGNFRIYKIYHLNFIQEGFVREFFLLESLTEEIMKAEKYAYEKVIRTISHEVNNTMGGVRSVLELIGDTTYDGALKKVVESCERRCESMSRFICEYADVVKLPDPVFLPIDLHKEIEEMVPFLNSMLPEGIKLFLKTTGEGNFNLNGDFGMLQQVILNIVKNAIESFEINEKDVILQGDKFIEIELGKEGDTVRLTISNNGKPIDENIASHLFSPFFTTKPDGKGIGLTLIRETLTKHGATYSLSSGKDGITRFIIVFRK